MILIVGLGNPERKYKKTRHNLGSMIVDQLKGKNTDSAEWEANKKVKARICMVKKDIMLVKPLTFMNDSGDSVSSLVHYFKIPIDNLYIVYDDLDINLGEYKIVKEKGPKDHGGINSIYQKLATKDFWHVRVGVENRDGSRIEGKEYVLMPFEEKELEVITRVIDEVVEELKSRVLD